MKRRRLIRNPIMRVLLIWAIESVALMILAYLPLGISVADLPAAVLAAAVIGLLNALLWPILTYILLPFAVFTLGLFALGLNGVIIWLAGLVVPGFDLAGLSAAVWAAIGLTAINTIASSLLTIDDDSSWYRNVVRRRAKRIARPEQTAVPGVIFLEIDGLSAPVLEKAIEEGYAPTMKRWLERGSHKLVEWETDLSSQTSASQAGILHGNNENIPAFRWYDRKRRQIVASSNPDEVARLEQEHSDGNGLLVDNGASRGNLLSGDAPLVSITASVIKDLQRLHTRDFYPYFANPYNFTRTLLLALWDVVLEKWQFWQARRKDIQPRLDGRHRGGRYPLLRAFTTIIMRELNIYTLIGDMYAGVPVAYATFVGYDEVAHHSGVESADALDILYKLDEQFARLESAARQAPRPYHFVVLSDHGQSGGATFRQRYGLTLQDLVQQLARTHRVAALMESNESWGHLNVVMSDAMYHDGKPAQALRQAMRKRGKDGDIRLGPQDDDFEWEDETAQIVVLASGNLGLVYLTNLDRRATMEELEALYPGLLDGLAQHEGIGWVMVHSAACGPVVIGKHGRRYLNDDTLEGENPLLGFGPHAADHLRRYDAFPDAPDIYVNSFYNPETNEVAAFEELIGSHGGLGGYQTRPFILHPAHWTIDETPLVGAAAVYRQFKRWLRQAESELLI